MSVGGSSVGSVLGHNTVDPHRPLVSQSVPELAKVREVIKLLENDGWQLVRTRGSHGQFKHATKPGTVTVSGKLSLDMPPGTLNSVLKQAEMK